MHDFLSRDLEARWQGEAVEVNRLAAQVVNVLAAKGQVRGHPAEPFFTSFVEAAASGNHAALAEVVHDMRQARISTRTIADIYIPEAARQLGAEWVGDCRSFADVTIGSALLQSLIRTLGAEWVADRFDDASASTVLVVVPDVEDHTLGALVATAWLRRQGVSVCLRLQPSAKELCDIAAKGQFDAVLMSWGDAERLDLLAELVKKVRASLPQPTPVFVGGSVVGRVERLKESTGADLATNELEDVMAWLLSKGMERALVSTSGLMAAAP